MHRLWSPFASIATGKRVSALRQMAMGPGLQVTSCHASRGDCHVVRTDEMSSGNGDGEEGGGVGSIEISEITSDECLVFGIARCENNYTF